MSRQELEQQILNLTVELGAAQARYEALRSQYYNDWNTRGINSNDEFMAQLKELASEMALYQKTYNELANTYAKLILETDT